MSLDRSLHWNDLSKLMKARGFMALRSFKIF